MTCRQILMTVVLGIFASTANHAEARNLFRQAEPAQGVEPLPIPTVPTRQGWRSSAQKSPYQAVQKMPYQAVQKLPYQATQKGPYQKGAPAARVRYVQHRPHRKTCCECSSSYQTVLTVIDPATCCPIDVPVCLPSCCTGYPQCTGRDGLFGRGITRFEWCCGYAVRVVVGHHGDVTVHYYGA